MDHRVRELERRWKQSGAVEDKVSWLLQRLRTGELDRRRVESAAMLGMPEARLVLEQMPGGGDWPTSLDNAVMMSLARMPCPFWLSAVEALSEYLDEIAKTSRARQAGGRMLNNAQHGLLTVLERMRATTDADPLWDQLQGAVVGVAQGHAYLGVNYPLGWERVRDRLREKLGPSLLGESEW